MNKTHKIFFCIFALAAVVQSESQSITVPLATTATIGTAYTLSLTAVDSTGKLNAAYSSSVTVTVSDKAAIAPQTVTFKSGKATLGVVFMTAGQQTISLTDSAATPLTGQASANVSTSSAAALSGCPSCFASLGAGAVVTSSKWGDYNNSSNILQATHLGASTPQYVAGVAYKLALRGVGYKKLGCSVDDFTTKRSDAKVAFCYPFKVFINLKFSPDSSQTFNGFTYGASHALHQYLDLMIGLSYTANNEISPGFQQAAVSVVKTQQAANNPYYSSFNLTALQGNSPTAYDGFPTQMLNANGTTGALIYTGSPTILHYHTGLFLGVAIPIGFKSALSGN